MKRIMKRLAGFACCVVLCVGAVEFGPAVYIRFFGEQTTQWISERFTETLLEKNELVVYQVETTGQETVTQDAWLIGTVQKVTLPYTFQMSYTVDLSQAAVTAEGNVIRVTSPSPKAGYAKLIVDEDGVQKKRLVISTYSREIR